MSRDLFDQKEEVIEEYMELSFNKLTASGRIFMADIPMEEHQDFDLVTAVAQELYEDSLDKSV
ncbi:MAG: hypothetical protein ACKN9V_06930 [Pseudomonadota bacterium]